MTQEFLFSFLFSFFPFSGKHSLRNGYAWSETSSTLANHSGNETVTGLDIPQPQGYPLARSEDGKRGAARLQGHLLISDGIAQLSVTQTSTGKSRRDLARAQLRIFTSLFFPFHLSCRHQNQYPSLLVSGMRRYGYWAHFFNQGGFILFQ